MASAVQKLMSVGGGTCVCGSGTYSRWFVQRRFLRSFKRQWAKREEREETIFEHVGKSTKPVERVYVWGNATTGALGKLLDESFLVCLYECTEELLDYPRR